MLLVDGQDDVGHRVRDLVVRGQVERRHADGPDHVLDFRVVSDHPEVLDVVLQPPRRVSADALWRDVTDCDQAGTRINTKASELIVLHRMVPFKIARQSFGL